MVRLAWPGWWLAFLVAAGSPVSAQANVFPATTIPFEISREVCARGHQPVVSLKIYNVLVQVVAIPTLASESGEKLDSLRLRCGEYRAFWDGKYLDGKREAITGVYYYQLTVDGERFTRKMIAQRKMASGR